MWDGVAARMPAYDRTVIRKYYNNVYKEKRYDPLPEDLLEKCCDLARTKVGLVVENGELMDEQRKISCVTEVCNEFELKAKKKFHLVMAMSRIK